MVDEPDLRQALDALANQLVWRIGKLDDEGDIVVRAGYATALATFAALPRLRSATDAELEAALRERRIRIEWIRSPSPVLGSHARPHSQPFERGGTEHTDGPAPIRHRDQGAP